MGGREFPHSHNNETTSECVRESSVEGDEKGDSVGGSGGSETSGLSSVSTSISTNSSSSSLNSSGNSSEAVRPQLSSQDSQVSEQAALKSAAAPLMHVIGDRVMQLLMEAQARGPPHTPHTSHTAMHTAHGTPRTSSSGGVFTGGGDVGAGGDGVHAGGNVGASVDSDGRVPVDGAQAALHASTAGLGTPPAGLGAPPAGLGTPTAGLVAPTAAAHMPTMPLKPRGGSGINAQLRARAHALLDRLEWSVGDRRGVHRQGVHMQHGLLRAWSCLADAAYFDAAPSRARQVQLCVAVYQACEVQLMGAVEGCVPQAAQWIACARSLSERMPVQPSPGWLEDFSEECRDERRVEVAR